MNADSMFTVWITHHKQVIQEIKKKPQSMLKTVG